MLIHKTSKFIKIYKLSYLIFFVEKIEEMFDFHDNFQSRYSMEKRKIIIFPSFTTMSYLICTDDDNLCKQLYPDQARHDVRPDLGTNCLTI